MGLSVELTHSAQDCADTPQLHLPGIAQLDLETPLRYQEKLHLVCASIADHIGHPELATAIAKIAKFAAFTTNEVIIHQVRYNKVVDIFIELPKRENAIGTLQVFAISLYLQDFIDNFCSIV